MNALFVCVCQCVYHFFASRNWRALYNHPKVTSIFQASKLNKPRKKHLTPKNHGGFTWFYISPRFLNNGWRCWLGQDSGWLQLRWRCNDGCVEDVAQEVKPSYEQMDAVARHEVPVGGGKKTLPVLLFVFFGFVVVCWLFVVCCLLFF